MSETIKKTEEKTIQIALSPPPAKLLKFRKMLIIFGHLFCFAVALMLSFLLANNMQFNTKWVGEQYPKLLVLFIAIKLVVFGFSKQYRGWWRYVGISDLIDIAAASLVSTLIIVALWFTLFMGPLRKIPSFENLTEVNQSVFISDMFFTFLLLGGLRMAIRLYYEEFRAIESGRLKRFLIVGAGNAAEALLREIHRMPVTKYDVVGFVDDDPMKRGINIHGIPVLGTIDQLPKICADNNIEEIAIAIPSASHQQLRHVIQLCEGIKVHFRTVPSITDIASGRFKVSQIRDVDINDLLGREVVQLDLDLIGEFATNKTILVTGAGGSIGSEMCRQLCNFKPKLLLLLEQAENPLFHIERELIKTFPDVPLKMIICDITDKIRVEQIFEQYRPQVVIHAAAHKHVPLMELNPGEAIKNNIGGSRIIADTADKYGSSNCVMISTDKAVNPTSIMGSTKRIAEMYIQNLAQTSKTNFVTVRFGNVLGSNGSVIPIFKQQIAEGGPVTVTDPEMKRYFMTIPEASQLVLQAASMGKGGEIFVLDMGEPVKIVDLARELIILSGFRPGEDIEITFTGLRPGEKLFEELSIQGENMQATRHPKISIWKNIPTDRNKLEAGIQELIEIAKTQERTVIVKKIKELVPEYIGNNNNHRKSSS
jgi:FlaA1/EpsC-like NDP-sugar epimerase